MTIHHALTKSELINKMNVDDDVLMIITLFGRGYIRSCDQCDVEHHLFYKDLATMAFVQTTFYNPPNTPIHSRKSPFTVYYGSHGKHLTIDSRFTGYWETPIRIPGGWSREVFFCQKCIDTLPFQDGVYLGECRECKGPVIGQCLRCKYLPGIYHIQCAVNNPESQGAVTLSDETAKIVWS